MGTNADVAAALREIGDLLDLSGERFKPEAYRRAARSIESLPEDLRKISARGELESIPGVGAAIGEKIREYLSLGEIPYLAKLRGEFPAGIVELMRLPGLGPKTARRFLVELQVKDAQELTAAIAAGRLDGMAGFGPRKIALLKEALGARAAVTTRTPLLTAWRTALEITNGLRAAAPVERIEIAGSLRRRRESVGDLDILVTSKDPERVFDVFTALPGVESVKLRGPTKETILYSGGLQVDLRVVAPEAFGAALLYFTGSKDHNVRVRSIARDRDLRLNEYGLTRGEERLAGATELEVYERLGLPWFPPEIRENQGEIDAAPGALPVLVELSDLKGDLHVHLPQGSGTEGVDELRAQAARRGWEYLGVVVPEDPSTTALANYIRAGNRADPGTPWLFSTVERPLRDDRPFPKEFDHLLATASGADPPASVGNLRPLAITHLPLASAGSEASTERAAAWTSVAGRLGCALEVTPFGPADGLDSAGLRRAAAAGVPILIRGDGFAHPDPLELAVGLARRGWATKAQVLNCRRRSELSAPATSSNRSGPPAASRGRRTGSRGPGASPP